MARNRLTLTVLSPRGEIEEIPTVAAPPRLSSLDGKRIGILDNGKTGGAMLLPYIEEAIRRRIHGTRLHSWKVPFAQPQQVKMPLLRELADYADGVIALMGD